MKKKPIIEELKIQSFATSEMKEITGGSFPTDWHGTDFQCGIISPSDHCCWGGGESIYCGTADTCDSVHCASVSASYCPTEDCAPTSQGYSTCTPGTLGC